MTWKIFTDGGARGNPGPGGSGAVIYHGEKCVARLKRYLGHTTNNRAEYTALVMALEKATELGADEIMIYMDSELIVKQMTGRYKIKDVELAKFVVRAHNLIQGFKKLTFQHIPRSMNSEADALVNEAIDENVLR